MYLIASGGVSSLEDLISLKEAGLPAAIVGKAYYEGRVTLQQLSTLI
jgi:phosphoribosylformimino-5-aminoimidazole carboxamide ribotide isomerase